MKIIKLFLILSIFFTFSISVMLRDNTACFQVSNPLTVINSSSQWYSAMSASFTIKNTCASNEVITSASQISSQIAANTSFSVSWVETNPWISSSFTQNGTEVSVALDGTINSNTQVIVTLHLQSNASVSAFSFTSVSIGSSTTSGSSTSGSSTSGSSTSGSSTSGSSTSGSSTSGSSTSGSSTSGSSTSGSSTSGSSTSGSSTSGSSTSGSSTSGSSCIQTTNDFNGFTYKTNVDTNGQWWSIVSLNFKLTNACSTSASLNGTKITVERLLINNGTTYSLNSSNPWFSMSQSTSGQNFILSLTDSTSLTAGQVLPVTITFGLSSGISSVSVRRVFTNDGSYPAAQVADVVFTVSNIPSAVNLPLNVQVAGAYANTYSASLGQSSNTYSIIGVPIPSTAIYSLKGYWGASVQYSSNTGTIALNSGSVFTQNITLSSTGLVSRQVTINTTGFDFTITNFRPVSLLFTSASFVYDNLAITSSQIVLSLPNEDISVTAKNPGGWIATLGASTIAATATSLSVSCAADTKKKLAGYFQTWSVSYNGTPSSFSLAAMPSYISVIYVSFAKPDMTYVKGSNSFNGTGLDINSTVQFFRDAITAAKLINPSLLVILSVGGATYPGWASINYQAIIDLVNDVGFDGIDLDHETDANCTGLAMNQGDTDNISCGTDNEIITIIDTLKSMLTSSQYLGAASWSVGAYGTAAFPATVYLPGPVANTGKWVNPLKKAGHKLDFVNIMSYDASPVYVPSDAFDAYKAIYQNGELYLGMEVPPEAWGGHVLTVTEVNQYAQYMIDKKGAGLFIWSLQKGDPNPFMQAACVYFNLSQCTSTIGGAASTPAAPAVAFLA